MAGFYYFFKNRSADELAKGEDITQSLLSQYGLAEVLSDVRKVDGRGGAGHATVTTVGSNAGPGGSCGSILTVGTKHSGAPSHVGNHPDRQHWVPLNPAADAWIGVLKNELPRPEDLERFEVIYGGLVTDRQHLEWIVPVCRAVSDGMPFGTLPQSYTFDANGQPQPQLDSSFKWLWQLSGEVQDDYRPGQKERDFNWLVKTAMKLLAVNYRIGQHELNLLHELGRPVLSNNTVGRIAQASYGWEVLQEAKKNSPDTEEPTAAK